MKSQFNFRKSTLLAFLFTAIVLSDSAVFAIRPLTKKEMSSFQIDTAHTYFRFIASTVLFKVQGQFDKYDVMITGDPDKLETVNVRIEIDADSINTANQSRDKHLRSEDFFDVKKFPKIVFTSNQIQMKGKQVSMQGTLEMRGVKKPISLVFDKNEAKNGGGVLETVYQTEAILNRKDFGIGTDSIAAKISLKDEIKLQLMLAGFASSSTK